MRIRGTKPEFWRSERIARVDWDARLVLKGLESYVDDNGVGKDDIALIVGDLFQRDLVREPSRTLARLSEAISALKDAGLLHRYEVDGTKLLYVSFWESVQRVDKPQAGRFPRPDGTLNYKESSIRESVASPREDSRTFAPVTGEQGNRGTEEQGKKEARPPVLQNNSLAFADRKIGGKELARRMNETARSVESGRIASAFSQSLATPLEGGLLAKVGVEIDKCLRSSIPPPQIAAGLRAWTDSDSWAPSQIPMFVNKAANRNGRGKPTTKALEYQDAAEALLAEVSTL